MHMYYSSITKVAANHSKYLIISQFTILQILLSSTKLVEYCHWYFSLVQSDKNVYFIGIFITTGLPFITYFILAL